MHSRRSPVVAPLALALPHPPLVRRRSSLLSNDARLPRTPTCGSPVQVFANANNRKSSDSWGSYDEQDEVEHEWKSEHTALLTRTLDALPAHLLTPFAGAPPSNLLDKVARGVITAKGAEGWPHSVRQTRVKLMEIVRARAKDERRKSTITEEGVEGETTNGSSVTRRPMHRQSSMDFMRNAALGSKNTEAIGRLSSRLQRAERLIPPSSYHPYTRPDPRTPSKANGSRTFPNTNPQTPSINRLTSSSTLANKRNSVSSTMSVSSNEYSGAPLLDPRVQRIRRSDSWGSIPFMPEPQPSPNRSLKRPPTYGASKSSHVVKAEAEGFVRPRTNSSESTVSSDEEEKQRARQSKKARRKSPSPPPPPPKPLPCSPALPDDPFGSTPLRSPRETAPTPPPKPSTKKVSNSAVRSRDTQRNSGMFGPELPGVSGTARPVSGCPSAFRAAAAVAATQPPPEQPVASRSMKRVRDLGGSPHPADSPSNTAQPRLRRVKAADFAGARRISFGSLAAAAADCIEPSYAVAGFGGGEAPTGLDGAFELR